jgi:hypothetical protein
MSNRLHTEITKEHTGALELTRIGRHLDEANPKCKPSTDYLSDRSNCALEAILGGANLVMHFGIVTIE